MASFNEKSRYSRQLMALKGKGQNSLRQSHIVIIGAGGIGSTVIMYLAGAGIGHLTIVDDDIVEVSNLHRQIIHSTEGAKAGAHKTESARASALKLNPNINITIRQGRFTTSSCMDIVQDATVVVDCTDNMETRLVLNDACFFQKVPLVSGSAVSFEGHATVFMGSCSQFSERHPQLSISTLPCYRCLHPVPSEASMSQSCAVEGVFGPAPGIVGCALASEAVKVALLHSPDKEEGLPVGLSVLAGKQAYFDLLTGETMTFRLPQRRDNCPLCSPTEASRTILCPDDTQRALDTLSRSFCARSPGQADVPSMTMEEYRDIFLCCDGPEHVLLDVRPSSAFASENLVSVLDASGSPGTVVHMELGRLRDWLKAHLSKDRGKGDDKKRDEDEDEDEDDKRQTQHMEQAASGELGLMVVCQRGRTSLVACKLLLEAGFPNVTNMSGGMMAWRDLAN